MPMSTATVSAGTTPHFVTVDPSGQYVYTANFGSNNVSQYSIGTGNTSTNGELTPIVAAVAAESTPIFVITVQ
jgi:DNA-binding beta-propeller fold protein YncE